MSGDQLDFLPVLFKNLSNKMLWTSVLVTTLVTPLHSEAISMARRDIIEVRHYLIRSIWLILKMRCALLAFPRSFFEEVHARTYKITNKMSTSRISISTLTN